MAEVQPFRLAGIQGAVYIAGSLAKLTDAYMWEYEEQQEVLDSSINGESFKRYTPDVATGRVRIQSFVKKPGDFTPVTSLMHNNNVLPNGVGSPLDFILHMKDGSRTVTGQGYLIRSQLHVARDGIITDEIEIQVDGRPTFVS